MNALMSAIVPANVSAIGSPPTVTPPPLVAANLPSGTVSITVTGLLPASTSAKLISVRALATSSVTVMLAGAVTVGASLTGVTSNVTEALSLCAPPLPVLPLSVIVTVRATSAVAFSAVVYVTAPKSIKALRASMLPVRVSALPVPPTVTPPPELAERLPAGTLRVTET